MDVEDEWCAFLCCFELAHRLPLQEDRRALLPMGCTVHCSELVWKCDYNYRLLGWNSAFSAEMLRSRWFAW